MVYESIDQGFVVSTVHRGSKQFRHSESDWLDKHLRHIPRQRPVVSVSFPVSVPAARLGRWCVEIHRREIHSDTRACSDSDRSARARCDHRPVHLLPSFVEFVCLRRTIDLEQLDGGDHRWTVDISCNVRPRGCSGFPCLDERGIEEETCMEEAEVFTTAWSTDQNNVCTRCFGIRRFQRG